MDLNNDGYDDIAGGSYDGEIRWYKGSEKGFLPSEIIKQDMDFSPGHFDEYMFTNPTFGDYNGDGLMDIFMGGNLGIRVALNVGTKECPEFGKREVLLREDGLPVTSILYDDKMIEKVKNAKDTNKIVGLSPYSSFVLFVDWDNDGTGDLLVSPSYMYDNAQPVLFYKGKETADGLRFSNKPVSLIVSEDGKKALPGWDVIPHVCDYNGDGIKDLLLGLSLRYDKANSLFNEYENYEYHFSPRGKEKIQKSLSFYRKFADDQEKIMQAEADLEMEYYIGPEIENVPEYISIGCIAVFPGMK